jgi:hypothetical protein
MSLPAVCGTAGVARQVRFFAKSRRFFRMITKTPVISGPTSSAVSSNAIAPALNPSGTGAHHLISQQPRIRILPHWWTLGPAPMKQRLVREAQLAICCFANSEWYLSGYFLYIFTGLRNRIAHMDVLDQVEKSALIWDGKARSPRNARATNVGLVALTSIAPDQYHTWQRWA